MTQLTPAQIAGLRHALEQVSNALRIAEPEDGAVLALANDLTCHDDRFERERLQIKRHRSSVTQGECTLTYRRRSAEPWECRFGDDIRLYIDAPQRGARKTQDRVVVGIPERGADVIAHHAGLGDARWTETAERIFYSGHLQRQVGAPMGIGLRSRDDAALLAQVRCAIALAAQHVDVPAVLHALSGLAELEPRPAPVRASQGPRI